MPMSVVLVLIPLLMGMMVVMAVIVVMVVTVFTVVVRLVRLARTLGGSVRQAHRHLHRVDRTALDVFNPHCDVGETETDRKALEPFPRRS